MIDKEIIERYIDLDKSCLTQEEKKEVMKILYKYKDAFSLRDEIGTCPNIEVEIDALQTNHHSLLDHTMLGREGR